MNKGNDCGMETTETERGLKTNERLYIWHKVIFSTANLVSSGSMVQPFLLALGVSQQNVSMYSSWILIAQVLAMVMVSFFCDRLRQLKKILTVVTCVLPVGVLAFILGGNVFNALPNGSYGVVLAGGILINLALGIINILTYKLPYSVIRIGDYGRLSSVSSVYSGLLGVGVTFSVSVCTRYFDPILTTTVAFSIGIVLWLLAALFNALLKVQKREEPPAPPVRVSLWKYPKFMKLAVPNFLRGFGAGLLALVVLVGTFDGVLNTETSFFIAFVTSAGTILGCLFFRFTEKRIGVRKLLILTECGVILFMPLIGAVPSIYAFCVFYFFAHFFNSGVDLCVPVMLYQHIPESIMGKYTAWRMLIYTFGTAIPGFLLQGMLNLFGSVITLGIGALCQLGCLIGYIVVLRKKDDIKAPEQAETERKEPERVELERVEVEQEEQAS